MSLFVHLLLIPSHPVPSYSSLAPAVKGRRDDDSLARAQRKERGEEGDESQSSQLVHQTIELSVFPLAKRCLARGRKHWRRRSSGRWLGGILYPTPSGWRSACLGAGETTPTHSFLAFRSESSKVRSGLSAPMLGRGPRRPLVAQPPTKY